MSDSYYDAVVLGTELGPLCCGALLARRGFRVLVLGQQDVPPTYELMGHRLQRYPLRFPELGSPVLRRVLQELGLTQTFRRMNRQTRVPFQIATPHHRLDVHRDRAALDAELEREFPKVKRPIEDFHRIAAETARKLDPLLERDMVWPPERFLERQQFARLRQAAGLLPRQHMADPLAELPEVHPWRRIVLSVARFLDGVESPNPPTLRLLQLYNNLYARSARLDDGPDALRELLLERIRSHSGESRLDERASHIGVRRGEATGVRLFGSGEEIGSRFVVVGMDLHAALRLLPDRAPFEEVFERVGEPQLQRYRYALNLIVERAGIPPGMGEDLFLLDPEEPSTLPLYLQRRNLDDAHCQLCVEAHLPARPVEQVDGYLEGARERIHRAVLRLLPFLEQYTLAVDSPHDEQPPVYRRATPEAPGPSGERRGPQTMEGLYGYPITRTLDLCALPVSTPIRRLLLCNRQVVPGLGVEGQLLAATSAARVITRSERSRRWMRAGLRDLVEV